MVQSYLIEVQLCYYSLFINRRDLKKCLKDLIKICSLTFNTT